MHRIVAHMKERFLQMLPAFLFFLAMFHLLLVTKSLILKEYGIATTSSAIAVVSALLVAKVVMLANHIPFLNLYPRKPLIWNVVLKTLVFRLATMVFTAAEQVLRLARQGDGPAAVCGRMMEDFSWPLFALRETWVFTLIFLYCIGSELARAIGTDKVREILFGARKTQPQP